MTTNIHPNLKKLSPSSVVTLHRCPRRFELDRLLEQPDLGDDDDVHTDYGSVVGIGVQSYLVTNDYNRAAFTIFLAWTKSIDDEDGQKAKKTFWHALIALDRFVEFRKTVFNYMELAVFDNKPAIELGFRIDCGDGFYYRGKLDAVLVNKNQRTLAVLENKTTKNKIVHEAMYKNSAQGGYSVVLDAVAQAMGLGVTSAWKVEYLIYKTFDMQWERLPITKTHLDRANWLRQILIDKAELISYAEGEYFPKRGESCYAFFRPCRHFDYCTLSNKILLMGKEPVIKEDKQDEYQFHFSLVDLIDSQLRRQEGGG